MWADIKKMEYLPIVKHDEIANVNILNFDYFFSQVLLISIYNFEIACRYTKSIIWSFIIPLSSNTFKSFGFVTAIATIDSYSITSTSHKT